MKKKLLIIAGVFMLVTANYAFAQAVRFPQSFVGEWYQKDEYNSDRIGGVFVDRLTITRTTIVGPRDRSVDVDGTEAVYPNTLVSSSGDSYNLRFREPPYYIIKLTIRLENDNLVITGDDWEGTWYSESNWNNRNTANSAANSYFKSADAAYNSKDYDKAITDYTQVIRLNPNYAGAYNNRGNAYLNKGNYEHAIADYNEAIRLNPNNSAAYNNRGNAYRDKGDYDRAIADYGEAIRLEPTAVMYINRGNAYFAKKDYDKAIADYNQGIRLDPNNANYKQGLEIIRQRGKSSTTFPTSFVGTWKRDNFNNTLTFTTNTLKASSQNNSWILSVSSGDSYTHYSNDMPYWIATVTIKLVNGNLVISGDSGDGENNWNGTWKKR